MVPTSPLFQMWIKTNRRWFARKISNLSMCQLLVNKNRDIKKRYNKDKDSTVYTIDYLSNRNPT